MAASVVWLQIIRHSNNIYVAIYGAPQMRDTVGLSACMMLAFMKPEKVDASVY